MVKLASLLYFAPLVLAGPYDHEVVQRSPLAAQDTPLVRRHDYIDNSGSNVNVGVTVPINDKASGHSLNIQIPHTSLVASAWSSGGGDGQKISQGFFAGRTVGRGTRNEIYGTARYGSGYGTYTHTDSGGYQYTPDYTLNVTGRDFPHGFPPINWMTYGGSESMIGVQDSDWAGVGPMSGYDLDGRPRSGALMGFIAMRGNETYWIMADGQTAMFLHDILQLPVEQGGCSILPYYECVQPRMMSIVTAGQVWTVDDLTPFVLSSRVLPQKDFNFHPWNVLQYYRGDSVALGTPMFTNMTYDNVFSHNNNSNADYWSSSPMNTTGIDMDFLNCLNTTIAAAVPIINPHLVVNARLTPGQIAGLVVGPIGGLCLLVALAWFIRRYRQRKAAHNQTLASRSRSALGQGKGAGVGEKPETDSTIEGSEGGSTYKSKI